MHAHETKLLKVYFILNLGTAKVYYVHPIYDAESLVYSREEGNRSYCLPAYTRTLDLWNQGVFSEIYLLTSQ